MLNRVVRWTPEGWEMEPDQRHVDLIIKELGLAEAKPASTPGEPEIRGNEAENDQVLSAAEASKFRGLAARANYLAADRTDIMYSVKEICRHMATPTAGAMKKLKRLGRYLLGNARLTTRYEWQGEESEITGYSDSDWAGCRVTGKSTSGGVIMLGSHFIKGWSRTQNHVTMSSAEAELIALVKCTTECMGVQSMYRDWGTSLSCNLYADSSAALAIAKRKGAGKLRHINVSALWIQDVQDREGASYMKVLGTENPADLMTKYLTREKVDNAIDKMGQAVQVGRASSSLDIQGKVNNVCQVKTKKREGSSCGGARASQDEADHWVADSGRVTRVHVIPRNSLLMAKVDDESLPRQSTQELGRVRVTKGTDHLGNEFILQDYWQASRRPTRKQPVYWTGTTSFQNE